MNAHKLYFKLVKREFDKEWENRYGNVFPMGFKVSVSFTPLDNNDERDERFKVLTYSTIMHN